MGMHLLRNERLCSKRLRLLTKGRRNSTDKIIDYVAAKRGAPASHVGVTRTVQLQDGSTAHEELTGIERPAYVGYETSDYSFGLKYLATGAKGQWWFAAQGSATRIRWGHAFRAKGWLGSVIPPLFTRLLWSGYMRACLSKLQQHFIEASTRTIGADASYAGRTGHLAS
jgi:hypothetical protein